MKALLLYTPEIYGLVLSFPLTGKDFQWLTTPCVQSPTNVCLKMVRTINNVFFINNVKNLRFTYKENIRILRNIIHCRPISTRMLNFMLCVVVPCYIANSKFDGNLILNSIAS